MTQSHPWLEAQFADIRPKAIAALTRQFRDLDLAEEAFATACMRALETWPKKGQPKDPFAWLLAVGRNAGRDILRRQKRSSATDAENEDKSVNPEDEYAHALDQHGLRDDVLRLLFICCHPAISSQDQAAVALRIVTGLGVDEIARAFLVKPKTMEQRITRAKQTIARTHTPFDTPNLAERSTRLNAVSLMVYLLFNEGWSASSGDIHIKTSLCEEAIRLVRLLLDLFPGISELMGLLSLFLFQHARREARQNAQGELVPLDEQDRTRWNKSMISEAQSLLEKALRHRTPGPYQIQAAISAAHATAATPAETDWHEIERLYRALSLVQPSPVVSLNHATAVGKVKGPHAALASLKPLAEDLKDYRWFHTARAAFELEVGNYAGAKSAFETALTLGPTVQERASLQEKIALCEKNI